MLVASLASTHLGREHQVELANVCPILVPADRANDTLVLDDLLQHLQVRTLHSLSIAGMKVIELLLVLQVREDW